ncbi:MAG: hypothetical protein ACK5VE_07730, partial [Alphaproteobacteria bacterium]
MMRSVVQVFMSLFLAVWFRSNLPMGGYHFRGDNIKAFIIGVVGRDEEGSFIAGELLRRGITLLDNKIHCNATPFNY